MTHASSPDADSPGPEALPEFTSLSDDSLDPPPQPARDPGPDFGAGLADAGRAEPRGKKRRRKKAAPKTPTASGEPDVPEAGSSGGERASGREGSASGSSAGGSPPPGDGGSATTKKKRKRSRRRKAAGTGAESGDGAGRPDAPGDSGVTAAAPAGEPRGAGDEEAATGEGKKRRRRRGSRGGRRRRKKDGGVAVEVLPGEDDDFPEASGASHASGVAPGAKPAGEDAPDRGQAKKGRKRSRRKKARVEDGEKAEDAAKAQPARQKKTEKKTQKKAQRKRGSGREKDLEPEPETEVRTQQIVVNAIDREERRVAVVEDEKIIDFLMTSESQKTLVNDIYRGKVVNLEPAIGAAFVDFGQGRNGFLHTSDVLAVYGEPDFKLEKLLTSKVDPEEWDDESSQPPVGDEVADDDESGSGRGGRKRGARREGRRRARERRPISELLRVGDPVVVQVTKDAIGDKGPTLTTYISIPGRYLVLMPSMTRTGVSRKIPDDKERRRLKRILESLKAPADMGVIVRTAGVGKTKTELQRDLDYLLGVWETFGKRLKAGRGPTPLYQESDVATRTLRDLFTSRTERVLVDDPVVHEQMIEFAHKLMPEHVDRIELHDGDRPVFHHAGIEQDFEKIFARRVDLPSGGSIVFDQAEALVAIDVNSGRTRTESFDFEEIALKTNLEAVPEIARQIRLRDLGGILVCDFIDMVRSSSNRAVERALRLELGRDRARSKLGRISQFGLLEMTRQRLGPGTHKKVFQTCPRCRGVGKIRTVESRAQAILRRLGAALAQKGFSTVEVCAHPEVVDYLREDLWDYLRALEHRSEKEIRLTAKPDQPEDSVLHYLRTDGKEVRPGGRRKR